MEILTANQRGGDAREKRRFSGFNLMKAYIVGHRHDFNELATRWTPEITAANQANLQLPANLKNQPVTTQTRLHLQS